MSWGILEEGKLGMRPNWEEFFMALAVVYSSRSSCRNVRAGSVLVEDKHIVGVGYNGAPSQIPSCYSTSCSKERQGLKYEKSLNTGTCVGIHAEMNALGNLTRRNLQEIQLYTTIFPCHDCAKNLLPYNLKEVFFKSVYSEKELESTIKLFEDADVLVTQLNLGPERFLDILFNLHPKFERKFDVWGPEEKNKIKELISFF
ncbi:MAG: hypothetical protein KKF68_02465 [Nanoarchaeota archaeon]|nr:hypothetical protein [Nanoarchaeota archaeon]